VILDIYSRYAVGWMLARAERAELSKRLINESIAKQGVTKDQLTIHSDRGSPMIAKGVAHLLADLGVTKSHSRPHVCLFTGYSRGMEPERCLGNSQDEAA
jgi:putative transposase